HRRLRCRPSRQFEPVTKESNAQYGEPSFNGNKCVPATDDAVRVPIRALEERGSYRAHRRIRAAVIAALISRATEWIRAAVPAYQNRLVIPSCTCREELTVRSTCPAVASGASFCVAPANTDRVGVAKFARLSTLNTSSRNCSLVLPASGWFLTSDMSTFAKPGPRRKFRGVLPNVPCGCSSNALVSNQWSGLPVMMRFGSVPGRTLGRSSAFVEVLPLRDQFGVWIDGENG